MIKAETISPAVKLIHSRRPAPNSQLFENYRNKTRFSYANHFQNAYPSRLDSEQYCSIQFECKARTDNRQLTIK